MTRELWCVRSTVVWLTLVIVTFVSWAASYQHDAGSGVGVIVLALAAVKIRFVGLDFMELRNAPRLLRGIFEAYCVILWLVLAGMYLWV